MAKIAIKRPTRRVAIKGPGVVKGIRVTSGPPGAPGPPGADGEVTTAAMNAAISTAIGDIEPGDIGAQPSDEDLTAIAALTTTVYGRAFLALANQAALMALVQAASATAQGKVELATNAEVQTGTDTVRAVTPAGFRAGGDDRYAQSTGGGREKSAALSATTGTATGDLNAASIFTVVPTGNITLAFSNIPAAPASCSLRVRVAQGATPRAISMPSGTIHWFTDQPVQTANKVTTYTLETLDGGTNWDVYAGVEK